MVTKTFKIKKESNRGEECRILKEITDWIELKICADYYDQKKGHYGDVIQKEITIKIELTKG